MKKLPGQKPNGSTTVNGKYRFIRRIGEASDMSVTDAKSQAGTASPCQVMFTPNFEAHKQNGGQTMKTGLLIDNF